MTRFPEPSRATLPSTPEGDAHPCRLGQAVLTARWPGPISMYTWQDYVFPAWMMDRVRAEDLDPYGVMARAMLTSIRDTAVPHRIDWADGYDPELRFD